MSTYVVLVSGTDVENFDLCVVCQGATTSHSVMDMVFR